VLARELPQAFAFGAEHESKRSRQRRSFQRLIRLLGKPHAKYVALAELAQGLREILDKDHRHNVERAARRLGENAVQRRTVPLGHDQACGAECRGRAERRADILRVGHLRALAETVEDHELLDPLLPPDRLLYRLFHEEQVRAFRAIPLESYCSCSRARVEELLRRFSAEDLAEMVVDGEMWVTCEFCNSRYQFDPASFADA